MAKRPSVAIVGPGRLGATLARKLKQAGYPISEIVGRDTKPSLRDARQLARTVRSRASTSKNAHLDADIVWFCVPDRAIAHIAQELASSTNWTGKVAVHSSGSLASDELQILGSQGATIASVHPMMTFVRGVTASLEGVPFGLEGDATALRHMRKIVRDLGGEAFTLRKQDKTAYHAWGSFLSPLLVAALVTSEQVARAAGLSTKAARKKMMPIVRQTVANYAALGPEQAFSGPIIRGDVATVRKHLKVLERIPEAREVYLVLARSAARHLSTANRQQLRKVLQSAKD